MGGKPDILRAIVFVFAVGLVITGVTTSLQAFDEKPAHQNNVVTGDMQMGRQVSTR